MSLSNHKMRVSLITRQSTGKSDVIPVVNQPFRAAVGDRLTGKRTAAQKEREAEQPRSKHIHFNTPLGSWLQIILIITTILKQKSNVSTIGNPVRKKIKIERSIQAQQTIQGRTGELNGSLSGSAVLRRHSIEWGQRSISYRTRAILSAWLRNPESSSASRSCQRWLRQPSVSRKSFNCSPALSRTQR